MGWLKLSEMERIAKALERLVALKEHEMGLRRVDAVAGNEVYEGAISYLDREKEWESEMRKLAYQEETGIAPPSEEAMSPVRPDGRGWSSNG